MRKSISRKIRFEVFKRDSFKCQYCGKAAPEVVLTIDHIKPVAKGGGNDIVNLITACDECNSGKSDRLLDDNAAVNKARTQLEKLQERREQLEMMMEWTEGLQDIKDDALNRLGERWSSLTPGFSLTEDGLRNIRQWMRRFGMQELYDAMGVAADQYLKRDPQGRLTHESVNRAFSKIAGICAVAKENREKPGLGDIYYIRGIVRNRFGYCDEDAAIELLRRAYDAGVAIAALRSLAKTARNWSGWRFEMEELIEAAEAEANNQ